jgi:hypothetical protein
MESLRNERRIWRTQDRDGHAIPSIRILSWNVCKFVQWPRAAARNGILIPQPGAEGQNDELGGYRLDPILEHFQEKWNPGFRQKMRSKDVRGSSFSG